MGRNGQADAQRRFSTETFATRFRSALAGREVAS
jgi:hypothetical protein